MVIVNGFSVIACLPASSADLITEWWEKGAVPQVIASISSANGSSATDSATA